MKKSNFIFESVLIGITLFLGLFALASFSDRSMNELPILFLLWLIPLGLMQLIHSLVLVNSYWQHTSVKNYLIIYYGGVLFDFILLFLGFGIHDNSVLWIAVIYLPLPLAAFLWYITYKFKEPALSVTEEKLPGDIF